MFYSHEILTNSAYGVTTVWLVSTIGLRSTTRKISRKAIQDVDVRQACKTILQPTAPIALRLQGSLLYGLSRVYSQQCHYVLTDAEKVQAHMRAFYNALGGADNALDPQAGKSRRKELILEDDPEFDLRIDLPAFTFDDGGNLIAPQGSHSQASRKTSSQLSPMQADGSFSSNRSFHGGFDLSQSPMGGGNFLIEEHFGAGSMTPGKGEGGDALMPFGDEERQLQAFDDWGIVIDVEGNVMEAVEEPEAEPELPQRPLTEVEEGANPIQEEDVVQFDDQGDVVMSGDGYAIPSDPPIPEQEPEQNQEPEREEQEGTIEDEVSSGQASVAAQRQRQPRRRPNIEPDDQTKITRKDLKEWAAAYLDNAEQARQPRHGATPAEARKNAFNLIFGRGISGIGLPTGIPELAHPLATHFAGEGLQARLLGIIIENPDEAELPRGRRRSALEALELEDEDERRVRRRLSEENDDDQAAQLAQHDDAPPLFGDDDLLPVEVGRRAGSVLPDDIPSDVPWNRHSSQIPSSSIKGGSNKPPSRQVSASPLHSRNLGPEIERYSDQPVYGSDGADFPPFLHSGGGGSGSAGAPNSNNSDLLLPPRPQEPDTTSQAVRKALDRGGAEFLSLVTTAAQEHGHPSPSGKGNNRQWVEFDSLFEQPNETKRETAVMAFYHVLSLATRNMLKVKQDGQGGIEPFGTIRLGVEVPAGVEDDEDMEGDGREL